MTDGPKSRVIVNATIQFDGFRFEDSAWEGTLAVPWLNDATPFVLAIDEEVASDVEFIPEHSKRTVEKICRLPIATRKNLEALLFRYYQSEVFNTHVGGTVVTPRLDSPHEIWRLVSDAEISIPNRRWQSPTCYFCVTLACDWDLEHGLGVLYDSNAVAREVCDPVDYIIHHGAG